MYRIRRHTAGEQQISHRLFKRFRVEATNAWNAYRAGFNRLAIVMLATLAHFIP
jgi:hypothetical protein